jgi:hypothetical protein
VDEVSKLGVGNGFIRKLSESGEVGTEFLELAIKVGGGFKETGRKVLGGKVPGKNDWVEGDAAVAVGGDGGVDKFDRAEGGKVNVGNVNELFLEVGAICALDLGEKRFWGVHEVAGGGDLVGGFLERSGFEAAMEMNAKFVLNEESTETRAGQVLT